MIETKNMNVNNGGTTMRYFLTLALLGFVMGLGACAPEDTISIDGPVPVTTENGDPMGNVVYNVDAPECEPRYEGDVFRDQCEAFEICVFNADLSAKLDLDESNGIHTCVDACQVEFETFEYDDGTSETVKVYDSCQRFGDDSGLYCDPTTLRCVEEQPEPDPCADCNQQPEQPVEPTPSEFVEVSCCFNTAHLTDNMYAQLAWSTSSPDNPENFGKDGDLELDEYGCFLSNHKVERANLFLGFWTELTDGKVQYLDANGHVAYGQWLGAGADNQFAPLSCEVDGVAVPIGNHMASCGFGIDEATNLSCLN